MYHSFLIHSSADRHLGCFRVLAIINSSAMNTEVHVSLSILVSSVCMPSSGIAGSYGSSISSFLRNLPLFSIMAVPVCIPTNSVRGFPFLHTLSSIYCLQIFGSQPMFIAALFIIARTWKQPKCPSADEWIRKLWYIYTMEYYSAIKKNI